jgi:PadR family transcriptional regulator AphA
VAAGDRLTTTSYALLGHLSMRPWTTYELAKQMRRNVRWIWPRAESRIYSELKSVVASGHAQASRTFTGKRATTTYSITPKGRQALREWFSTVPAPMSHESEGLLRVFLGAEADPAALLQAVRKVGIDGAEIREVGAPIGEAYLAGTAPFQDQVHVRAFVLDFLWSYSVLLSDWAERTAKELERWPRMTLDQRRRRGQRIIAARMGRRQPGSRPPASGSSSSTTSSGPSPWPGRRPR